MTAQTPDMTPPGAGPAQRPTWPRTLAVVLISIAATAVVTAWLITTFIFPTAFTPVSLSPREERTLEAKLQRLEPTRQHGGQTLRPPLQPERYSEAGATREVVLTERELNALLAKNTDLATRLAIDLSDNLASAKLLVPLDEDFPVLGGKTVKLTAGLELRYAAGRPVVVLRGVSLWGVPLPNAWLGNLKNVDLVREFGGEQGFWKSFAAGIEDIRVEDGVLRIKLKE